MDYNKILMSIVECILESEKEYNSREFRYYDFDETKYLYKYLEEWMDKGGLPDPVFAGSLCLNDQDISKVLDGMDEIMGGFGIEAVEDPHGHWDSYWQGTGLAYVNTGDTYSLTFGYDVEENEFLFTTLGGWLEAKGIDERY